MRVNIHGTLIDSKRRHPVFDLRHWESEFPLSKTEERLSGWIDHPCELALREQVLQQVKRKEDLGPCVPADVFVWAITQVTHQAWLTRLGGRPYRPKGKPWPRDEDGIPLKFLGQINFADSKDILPCKLPGDIAQLFGTYEGGNVLPAFGSVVLEWSSMDISDPEDGKGMPWSGELPFCYQGVVHRTTQYIDHEIAEAAFEAGGYEGGGHGVYSMQATSISTYAEMPQYWPFEPGDGNILIATLSSFYLRGKWPLCDVPQSLEKVYADGRRGDLRDGARDLGIGDAGCIWIYRDKEGAFKVGVLCG